MRVGPQPQHRAEPHLNHPFGPPPACARYTRATSAKTGRASHDHDDETGAAGGRHHRSLRRAVQPRLWARCARAARRALPASVRGPRRQPCCRRTRLPSRHRQRRGPTHLRPARSARQPARPLAEGAGDRQRRPACAALRQVRLQLHRDPCGAEAQRRLRPARSELPRRSHRLHRRGCRLPRHPLHRALPRTPRAHRRRDLLSRYAPGRARRPTRYPADPLRAGTAARGPRLHHLHFGLHRQTQGRADRSRADRQLHPRRCRGLRHPR